MKKVFLFFVLCVFYGVHGQSNLQRAFTSKKDFASKSKTSGPLRVLALRVQFKADNSGQTTGNGRFDLRDLRDSLRIDPAPHDKRYFEDHLLSMRNYFYDVSDGALDITYTVKPNGDTAAYNLSRTMEYYGRIVSRDERDELLAELLHDAITTADTTDGIDFSQYDHVIVFHAGVGQDFSLEDATPRDIPSRFVTPSVVDQKYSGGISVNNGAHHVQSGIIVPETESQYFTDAVLGVEVFREIGLNGILIANFGSALGMPDMFNTDQGTPGIGVFGLEDQGAVNGDGMIPAEPDPWTKIYMGWAQPIVVTDTIHAQLQSRKTAGHSVILKVPVSASEYYLIENRQRDVISNTLSPETLIRIDTIYNVDNTIDEIDTAYMTGVERSPVSGVITKVDEYDSALPGSGLLIWHVDENVIAANLSDNAINNNIERRGVRVVEGSGSQDIGRNFQSFFGTTVGAGDKYDFFFHGNEGFRFYNKKTDSVFFDSKSVPAALTYDRASTGVRITGISVRQPVMAFNLQTSLQQNGFPQYTGVTIPQAGLTWGNIQGDAQKEIIAVSEKGLVFVWQANGSEVIDRDQTITDHRLGQDSVQFAYAWISNLDDSVAGGPAISDLDQDGYDEIIITTKSGKIFALRGTDGNNDKIADTLFVYLTGQTITTSAMVLPDRRIVVGTSTGNIIILHPNGVFDATLALSSAIRAIARLENDYLVVATRQHIAKVNLNNMTFTSDAYVPASGSVWLVAGDMDQNGVNSIIAANGKNIHPFYSEPPFTYELPSVISAPPVIGDIDGDEYPDIVFAVENFVYALNHNGALVNNFPVRLSDAYRVDQIISSPLLADIDNDGQCDILIGGSDGLIYAVNARGEKIGGFPLTIGDEAIASPMITDLDGDFDLEMVSVSAEGYVYNFDLPATLTLQTLKWPKYGRDLSLSHLSNESNTPDSVSTGVLMPARSVYNYPNPTRGERTVIRYFLSESAKVSIKIFDLAGDLVTTLHGPGLAQTDNEVVWNLDRVQSGVYFAKVQAKTSSGKKEIRTVKIAVTK
ncbi:T9SS type A sorting domain-containing protein [bacterium]|nr:T9SS type A sorting domain-containing protein [bacterium]NUN46009.1 T9SS type A sorting domain-containing protein [bacterium]